MRLALSATSASSELDLHSAGFVALEIEETAYDYFAELTSRRGGVPAHADCSTDVTRMIFRRPSGLSGTDESCELRPGLTLRFSGTVPLRDEAELAKAAELPSWLAPPDSRQPANDNEQEETPELPEPQHTTRQEERAPAFSDEALALDFAKAHSGDLRFVAA